MKWFTTKSVALRLIYDCENDGEVIRRGNEELELKKLDSNCSAEQKSISFVYLCSLRTQALSVSKTWQTFWLPRNLTHLIAWWSCMFCSCEILRMSVNSSQSKSCFLKRSQSTKCKRGFLVAIWGDLITYCFLENSTLWFDESSCEWLPIWPSFVW